MARFNVLLSGYSVIDEIVNRSGSTAAPIGHDYIVGNAYEIWTGAGKTGTKLVLNTDYTINNKNDYYSAPTQANTDIYTKVAIINGAYQNVNLYQTYTTIGDMLSIENIKEVVIGNTAIVTGNYTIPESVGRVFVNTQNPVTLTIAADHPQLKNLEIGRLVASTNAVTLAASGTETINGAASFVTHGATVSSVVNNNIVKITKTGSRAWTWTDGIVSGSQTVTDGTKSWEKRHTGYSTYRFTGTTAAAAGAATYITTGLNPAKVMSIIGSFITSASYKLPFESIEYDGTRTSHLHVYMESSGVLTLAADTALSSVCFSRPCSVIIEYYE